MDIPQGFGEGEFTLEFWMKPDNSFPLGNPSGGWAQLYYWSTLDPLPASLGGGYSWWYKGNFLLDGHNNSSDFSDGTFSLQFYGGGYLRWLFGDGTELYEVQTYPAATDEKSVFLLDGNWHHVALTRRWEGTNQARLEMFIDGNLTASNTISNRINMRTFWDTWQDYGSAQAGWFWGAEKQACVKQDFIYEDYKGHLDELIFWSRAKTSTEILDTFTNGLTNLNGIVGRYRIEEGSGNQTCNELNPNECINLINMNPGYWSTETP